MLMMMMFIGTETLVTQLVYERSRMHAPSAPIIVRMPVRERGRESVDPWFS